MKKKIKFNLYKNVSSQHCLPPDDPLNELSPFELGMRRFCYEQNQEVLINIGCESKTVLLFPDMSLILETLPEQLRVLSEGDRIELEFPENWMTLTLSPIENRVIGTVTEYGTSISSQRFELILAQVLDELRDFGQLIVQRAVEMRYITKEDGNEFLGVAREEKRIEVDTSHLATPVLPTFYGTGRLAFKG